MRDCIRSRVQTLHVTSHCSSELGGTDNLSCDGLQGVAKHLHGTAARVAVRNSLPCVTGRVWL